MKTSLDVVGKFLSGGLHNVFRELPSDFIEVWLLMVFFGVLRLGVKGL